MKTPDRTDVIQGDEQRRDGHYRAKQDLREQTATTDGAKRTAELDPNDPTSLQAQNPFTFGNLRVGPASEEAAGIPAICASQSVFDLLRFLAEFWRSRFLICFTLLNKLLTALLVAKGLGMLSAHDFVESDSFLFVLVPASFA
jgi:hypothetical protein